MVDRVTVKQEMLRASRGTLQHSKDTRGVRLVSMNRKFGPGSASEQRHLHLAAAAFSRRSGSTFQLFQEFAGPRFHGCGPRPCALFQKFLNLALESDIASSEVSQTL